jgi:hypothetical protein
MGMLGEKLVGDMFNHFGIDASHVNEDTHDFLLGSGETVEVKARYIGVSPKPEYWVSLNQPHQNADWFIIVMLQPGLDGEFRMAHFIGGTRGKDLSGMLERREKGDKRPNGQVAPTGCWDLTMRDLTPIKDILAKLKM